MRIFVNGDQHDVNPRTLALALALEELGYRGKKIATAVNGRFVAAALRPDTPLADGDRIEVVAPMQGG
jgi:sulfur carrier protein